ncbi:MAG: hypothetical protein QF921_01865 [Pseudomonadales bacterium]|nr:hypothetical protein [Pseudomonadales bacterium]MDP6828178.1 hypothetical protein [Pseudomonadales bacterium]MDP6970256.1 hypothetical protein [Pseudomonadales bacterium]
MFAASSPLAPLPVANTLKVGVASCAMVAVTLPAVGVTGLMHWSLAGLDLQMDTVRGTATPALSALTSLVADVPVSTDATENGLELGWSGTLNRL